jgi:hypothetical protein
VRQTRLGRLLGLHGADVDHRLGHGLVAGDLGQLAVTQEVAAAVTYLEQVAAGPYAEIEGQRGGHAAVVGVFLAEADELRVALMGAFPEGIEQRLVVVLGRTEVAAGGSGDVSRDRLERDAAGRLAPGRAANAICYHGERRQALALGHEPGGVGDAGEPKDELLPEGAEDEVVLVVLPDLAGIGHAVDVDLVFAGFASDGGVGGGGLRGGHGDSGCVA